MPATIAVRQKCTKMFHGQVHDKLTSKASREALTCYISSLKSIGSVVVEL